MKHILLLLFLLVSATTMAQEETISQDTTLFVNGRKIVIKEKEGKIKVKLYEQSAPGDTIENDQIFEGVYKDGQSTERRTAFSVPFMKKKNLNKFEPHIAGFYMGYTRMANDFDFSNAGAIDLNNFKSWEIGFTLFEGSIALSRNHQWGLVSGLGWGYTAFRASGNYAFRETEQGTTSILPGGTEEDIYSQSRLRYFYFRIPLALEWQQKINNKELLFFSLGAEAEIRHGVRSMGKIDGHKETFDKGLNVRPVGINLLAQAGYDDIGIYLRYSTYSLFEHNKGPKLYPWSFGFCLHW